MLGLNRTGPGFNAASEMFVRRKEDCDKIDANTGEIVYELVGCANGGTKKHSIAFVEILQGGCSKPHYHPKAEESYMILEGEGKLVINGVKRTVTAGDVVKIPVEAVHQIFNKKEKPLHFYCICAPAWTYEGFIPVDKDQLPVERKDNANELYVRRKEECQKFEDGDESIYEYLGVNNGQAQHHSLAEVEIIENGKSSAHFHPEAEESYIILEGEGKLIINGEERVVKPGDVANIPVGKTHQIFNNFAGKLKFLVVCAPAWIPECLVPVK